MVYQTGPSIHPVPPLGAKSQVTTQLASRIAGWCGHRQVQWRLGAPPSESNHVKHQWPFQDPKLEVPTIYKAYVREYPHKIWPYMVQYLHFRILKSPLSNMLNQVVSKWLRCETRGKSCCKTCARWLSRSLWCKWCGDLEGRLKWTIYLPAVASFGRHCFQFVWFCMFMFCYVFACCNFWKVNQTWANLGTLHSCSAYARRAGFLQFAF